MGLKKYIVYGIVSSLVAFGGTYLVKSYFLTKAKLTHAEDRLRYLADQQVESERAILLAENDLAINLNRQRHAIEAIIKNGHLPGKFNPSWMLEHESPGGQNKHSSASPG